MSSHSVETHTNGDGFGVGWYDPRGRAGLFRSIRPARNDRNLREVCAFVEEVSLTNGIADPLWMTLGFSDRQKLYGVRYASDGDAPTLYHRRWRICTSSTRLCATVSPDARAVVSEPPREVAAGWTETPQKTVAIVERGEIEYRPFEPRVP